MAPLYLTYLILIYSILLTNVILLIIPMMIHVQRFQVQLLKALKHDSKIAIEWFHQNCMEANPSKFQFMVIKSFISKELLPKFIDINDTRIETKVIVRNHH